MADAPSWRELARRAASLAYLWYRHSAVRKWWRRRTTNTRVARQRPALGHGAPKDLIEAGTLTNEPGTVKGSKARSLTMTQWNGLAIDSIEASRRQVNADFPCPRTDTKKHTGREPWEDEREIYG